MATRIEMMINNSGDPQGVVYTIYRENQPGVVLNSPVIATVDETNVLQTAFQRIGEQLVQDPMNPFMFYTSRVYEQDPVPVVYIDGKPIQPSKVTLGAFSKKVVLNDQYDLTANSAHKITMDYWYLSSIFKDDLHPQKGVNYFGPVANALNPILGFSMSYDDVNYEMDLQWSLDTTAKKFYYKIRSQDRNGYLSDLSAESMIPLGIDPVTVKYVVQKSTRQTGPWQTVATVSTPKFSDPNPTPAGHIALRNYGSKYDTTTAQLSIQNAWYNWKLNWRPSYFYQVYPVDDEGFTADPRPVPPQYLGINIKPVKIVVRRKEDNGLPATLDGTDAVTVTTVVETQQNPAEQMLSFKDSFIGGKVYGYTVYIIDAKGLVGDPGYFTVDMR